MKNISVIGAGTMGNGITHVFAQNNYQVTWIDISREALENGTRTIERNLDRLISKEKISSDIKSATLSNIVQTTSIAEGVSKADLVIEAATENEEVKLDIFEKIDKYAPVHAILASNTSSISITKIASATQRKPKVIGMHFMNPVPMMPLVEIIKGSGTDLETLEAIISITHSLGKSPVEVNDYPGFVANRILIPMINEAIISLHEGVAGVEEIDSVMKLGMSHPMGPLQLADFIGLDVCLSIMNVLYHGLGNPKYAPCPLLNNMVNAGVLGVKSGEGFYIHTKGSKEIIVSNRFI